MSEHMPMALLDWRKMEKNSLRGFATVRLGKAMKIADISVHCSNGKRWASLPSKPLIDANGQAKRDDKGKVIYVPILAWLDRDTADRFSEGVLAVVEAAHPGETGIDG